MDGDGDVEAASRGGGAGNVGEIESVFRDGLKVKRAVQVTCPHCKKRFRHYLADMGVRLGTTKLILERLVCPERDGGAYDEEDSFVFDP